MPRMAPPSTNQPTTQPTNQTPKHTNKHNKQQTTKPTGKTRAQRTDGAAKAMCLQIHGDAAMSGQVRAYAYVCVRVCACMYDVWRDG
jgi:hypothetical protein